MIRSTVTVQSGLGKLTEQVQTLARELTRTAAEQAAAVAQQNASIDLQLQLVPPHQDPDGVAAGIRSEKTGQRDVRIARFFDQGTLGNRRRKLKRAGRDHWTVKRASGSYTAQRGDVTGKGIPAERFFPKARAAGRRAMLGKLKRGL